jgi:hypothetical protein
MLNSNRERGEVMSRYAGIIFAMLVAWNAIPTFAQTANQDNRAVQPLIPGIFEGTPQEQAACAADVRRYCRDEIPDTFEVLACLKAEREKISRRCQQVLLMHGQ